MCTRASLRRSCGTQFAITMEIYTVVSSAATREALKKLDESLDH